MLLPVFYSNSHFCIVKFVKLPICIFFHYIPVIKSKNDFLSQIFTFIQDIPFLDLYLGGETSILLEETIKYCFCLKIKYWTVFNIFSTNNEE